MATSELAPQPVSFHAAVFFLVYLTYCALIWELVREEGASARVRKAMRRRRWRCSEAPRSWRCGCRSWGLRSVSGA
jgi:hypothetical protein